MFFQSSVKFSVSILFGKKNIYLTVLNGKAVAMVNGEINDALHKVKDSINCEVFKDLYKSKAS